MNKLEIHKLALLAAAKITVVAGSAGCQGERAGAIRREPVAPSTQLVVQAAPPAAQGSSCETHASAAAPPKPASPPATRPAPAATPAKPVGAASLPAPILPTVIGQSSACAAGARAAQQTGVTPPAVAACCNAILASDPSTSGIDWSDAMACCGVPGVDTRGKAFCSPWGPPAPPAMPAGWLS